MRGRIAGCPSCFTTRSVLAVFSPPGLALCQPISLLSGG